MAEIIYNGEKVDSRWGFMLLSRDERQSVLRSVDRGAVIAKVDLPSDRRTESVACEGFVLGLKSSEIAKAIINVSNDGWVESLDLPRIQSRLIYERMYESRTPREVHGFRKAHIDVLEREINAGSSSFETACALWRTERRLAREKGHVSAFSKKMPLLNLDQQRLPEGVRMSKTFSLIRSYEPLFIFDNLAHPVTVAWSVLPSEDVRAYANEVGTWMRDEWPASLDATDQAQDHAEGYILDRRNTRLAAESYARGFVIEEAAQFIFEQRIRQEEAVA